MKLFRRRAWLLGSVLIACAGKGGSAVAPAPAGRVVYVVRHAEKMVDAGDDPPLTDAGTVRAAALPALVPPDLVAIYSTETLRTRATVQPVAEARGIEIQPYEASDHAGLLAAIRAQPPGPVLVAGHSNTIPAMLATFGVAESVTIEHEQYGDLFVVQMGSGDTTLRIQHFGAR